MRAPTLHSREPAARWSRRLGWMLALWSASVAALALVAWLLNGLMGWAGLVR